MIDGVIVRKLVRHVDERGYLMEMLRADNPEGQTFGQSYVCAVNFGVVKAWHKHKHQTDYFVCVSGMAKVVLIDLRDNSPTYGVVNEFFMGDLNPIGVVIPKGVYHGMKGISGRTSIIVNTPDRVYDYMNPDEYRKSPNRFNEYYHWGRVDG